MRIIEALGAQGEIRIFRVDKIPAGAKTVEKEAGEAHYIIGPSETGQHHVLVAGVKVFQSDDAPDGMLIL